MQVIRLALGPVIRPPFRRCTPSSHLRGTTSGTDRSPLGWWE